MHDIYICDACTSNMANKPAYRQIGMSVMDEIDLVIVQSFFLHIILSLLSARMIIV